MYTGQDRVQIEEIILSGSFICVWRSQVGVDHSKDASENLHKLVGFVRKM
jgi:hypothetical protein